jgi:hypothetical protein
MITATRYLNDVQSVICALGHRDQRGLKEAVSIAAQALRNGFSEAVMFIDAKRAYEAIKGAMYDFKPGTLYWDAPSENQFTSLMQGFSLVVKPAQGEHQNPQDSLTNFMGR